MSPIVGLLFCGWIWVPILMLNGTSMLHIASMMSVLKVSGKNKKSVIICLEEKKTVFTWLVLFSKIVQCYPFLSSQGEWGILFKIKVVFWHWLSISNIFLLQYYPYISFSSHSSSVFKDNLIKETFTQEIFCFKILFVSKGVK